MARLRRGFGLNEKHSNLAAEMDKRFTSQAIEERVCDASGRRAMFRDAGVMMEMADYAERNGEAETAPLVANLRSHAVSLRIATAKDAVRIPAQHR